MIDDSILVFCRPEDSLGSAIYAELRARQRHVLLITEVSDLKLTCHPGAAVLQIADSLVIEPRCIFFRGTPEVRAAEESREYVENQWQSALSTWLEAQACPIYNKPLRASHERWRRTAVDIRFESSRTGRLAVHYASGEDSSLSDSSFAYIANRMAGPQELSEACGGRELLKTYSPRVTEIWSCWIVFGRCVLAGHLEDEEVAYTRAPPSLTESIAGRNGLATFFGLTWWIRVSGRDEYLMWDIDYFPSTHDLFNHVHRVASELVESLRP